MHNDRLPMDGVSRMTHLAACSTANGHRLLFVLLMSFLLSATSAIADEAATPHTPNVDQLELLKILDEVAGEEIATRLAAISGMDKVQVYVSGGVVRLRGDVYSELERQLAEKIAANASGVIHVVNQLEIDTDLTTRIAPVADLLQDKSWRLLRALPLLLAAGLIVVGFWWLGGWLGRRRVLLRRAKQQPFLGGLLRQAVRLLAVLVGLLLALDLLNATALVGALLGAAGIVGIAFGFAFRDVAENYIAGILLSLRQPFLPNDHVVIDGHEGRVASLNSRATILLTQDGNHLRLPNAQVFKGVILNYSRNPTRRFSFNLGVANDADLETVQQIGIETLTALPDVLTEPKPVVLIADVGDSSMTIRFAGWIDQRHTGFAKIRSEAIRLVKLAFEREGIDMPDPGYRVELSRKQSQPGAQPRAAASSMATSQGDVSPEVHVSQAIERERANQDVPDLLSPEAPRE